MTDETTNPAPAEGQSADKDARAHAMLDRVRAEGAVEALEALIDGWAGGTGHMDGNRWVNMTTIKAARDRYRPRVIPPVVTPAEPCEHDRLGCRDRTEHPAHTKVGDGRPCCGWPPQCTGEPGTGDVEALTEVKVLIRDLGDMACIGCRKNTCPACGLAAEVTSRIHVLLADVRRATAEQTLRDAADEWHGFGQGRGVMFNRDGLDLTPQQRVEKWLRDRAARLAREEGARP